MGVGVEGGAAIDVEAVDRVDQPEIGDLDQIVGRLVRARYLKAIERAIGMK